MSAAVKVSRKVREAISALAELRATDHIAADMIVMDAYKRLNLVRAMGVTPETLAGIPPIYPDHHTTKEH